MKVMNSELTGRCYQFTVGRLIWERNQKWTEQFQFFCLSTDILNYLEETRKKASIVLVARY